MGFAEGSPDKQDRVTAPAMVCMRRLMHTMDKPVVGSSVDGMNTSREFKSSSSSCCPQLGTSVSIVAIATDGELPRNGGSRRAACSVSHSASRPATPHSDQCAMNSSSATEQGVARQSKVFPEIEWVLRQLDAQGTRSGA